MSLKIVLPALEAALGQPVKFSEEAVGGPAKRAVACALCAKVLPAPITLPTPPCPRLNTSSVWPSR